MILRSEQQAVLESTTTVQDILDEIRQTGKTDRDCGTMFERLMAKYLMIDPQYADRLSHVWLWSEWPDNGGPVDTGIDHVAKERGTGEYWAIQCKFYSPNYSLQKADIDTFFKASGQKFMTDDWKRSFSLRIIVSTTDKSSKNAENALVKLGFAFKI